MPQESGSEARAASSLGSCRRSSWLPTRVWASWSSPTREASAGEEQPNRSLPR